VDEIIVGAVLESILGQYSELHGTVQPPRRHGVGDGLADGELVVAPQDEPEL
jgi:hypothetical protein